MNSDILLVEDDSRIVGVLADFLEAAGYHVEIAAEGAAGMRMLGLADAAGKFRRSSVGIAQGGKVLSTSLHPPTASRG